MSRSRLVRWIAAGLLATPAACTPIAAISQPDLEAFDGSFRLETGEIITGGYMVEEGRGRYLYLDTEGLVRGGVFERTGETVLRSIGLLEDRSIEIEFLADSDRVFNSLRWRERGLEPIYGKRVYPHRTLPIGFDSDDGTRLEGRLLLPDCAGPHPAVVAVHGSGPVNRFGATFHTFFAKYGVAVLAYDKRGYTDDPETWLEPDLADLSADAAAAVRFAASVPEIDRNRIGLFGASQGGWVVPPAAVAAPETDFQILRAGAAVTPAETNLHEVRQELRAEGLSGLDLDYAMALRREIYSLASSGAPITAADSLAAPYREEPWYSVAFGAGPVSQLWSADFWGWAARNNDRATAPYLTWFDGPVLWFLAEKDENVPLIPTRTALENAFKAAPGDDHEVVVIRDAPHSFVISEPGGEPRYADGFFNHMGAWLTDRGLTNPGCWQTGSSGSP